MIIYKQLLLALINITNEGLGMTESRKKLLNKPPYIQLAIDIPNLNEITDLFSRITRKKLKYDPLIEIGTPLLKNEGLKTAVPFFKRYFPNNYLIADLKTLDVGRLEVNLGYNSGVNACVVSGLAPIATINQFIQECELLNIDSWIDTLGLSLQNLNKKIKLLNQMPTVLIIHRGIDEELSGTESPWDRIKEVKKLVPSLIASAGGITLDNVLEPKKFGADIFIIGRAIYTSDDPQKALNSFYSSILD
jgi:bifunctional enzyme Fae/Hps